MAMRKHRSRVKFLPITHGKLSQREKELQQAEARSHAAIVSHTGKRYTTRRPIKTEPQAVDELSSASSHLGAKERDQVRVNERDLKISLLAGGVDYIDRVIDPSTYHDDAEVSQIVHFRKYASTTV